MARRARLVLDMGHGRLLRRGRRGRRHLPETPSIGPCSSPERRRRRC